MKGWAGTNLKLLNLGTGNSHGCLTCIWGHWWNPKQWETSLYCAPPSLLAIFMHLTKKQVAWPLPSILGLRILGVLRRVEWFWFHKVVLYFKSQALEALSGIEGNPLNRILAKFSPNLKVLEMEKVTEAAANGLWPFKAVLCNSFKLASRDPGQHSAPFPYSCMFLMSWCYKWTANIFLWSSSKATQRGFARIW